MFSKNSLNLYRALKLRKKVTPSKSFTQKANKMAAPNKALSWPASVSFPLISTASSKKYSAFFPDKSSAPHRLLASDATNTNIFGKWVDLAKYYSASKTENLGQHYLYAAAYYQCALAEHQANADKYNPDAKENIYCSLADIEIKLLHELCSTSLVINEKALLQRLKQDPIKLDLMRDRQKLSEKLHTLLSAANKTGSFNLEIAQQYIGDVQNTMQNLVKALWERSIEYFTVPCDYAVIAFGSLADGLATLHSDLEFGILIKDASQKDIFRKISQLMQFYTILLGETTMPILRPPEYNKPEFAELFKSCHILNGVSFDGAGPGGGKTPLGVAGLFELIAAPAELAAYQQRDWAATKYRTLPLDIAHTVYITGSAQGHELFSDYRQQLSIILAKSSVTHPLLTISQHRALMQLTADVERFAPKVGRETMEGRDYAAKQDFLRLPAFAIRYLGFYNGIVPDSSANGMTLWQILNELAERGVFQPAQTASLKELLCLTTLIRLDCYLYLQEQAERISVAGEQVQFVAKQSRAYSIAKVLRDKLYATLFPLYDALQHWRQIRDKQTLYFQPYDPQHPFFQARLTEQLLQYQLAEQHYQQALNLTHSTPLQMNVVLAHRARLQGKQWDTAQTKLAIKNYQHILENYQSKLSKDSLAVATCKAELAGQYALLGKYDQALQYIDEAIYCFTLQRGDTDLETVHCELMKQQILQASRPDQSLLERLYEAYQRRQQEPSLQQSLSYYVAPQATKELNSNALVELLPQLHAFMQDEYSRSLLLLGDSGSGKSLTLHYFEKELWQLFEEEGKLPTRIPLFIELKSLHNLKDRDFLPEILTKEYGYSPEQIQQLKRLYNFIFILDGYDELSNSFKQHSLYQNIVHNKWNAKIIISCRTQYLSTQQAYGMVMSTTLNSGRDSVCWYIAPFTVQHIRTYLINYVNQQPHQVASSLKFASESEWTPEQYWNYYQSIPGLMDLVRSPLLLKIVTEIAPILAARNSQQASLRITRHGVYAAFIEQWFEREVKRLQAIMPGVNLPDTLLEFVVFAERLAFRMFKRNELEVEYKPPDPRRPYAISDWHDFFGSDNEKIVHARAACPLRRNSDFRYSFIHKSFMEYFVADYIYVNLNMDRSEHEFVVALQHLPQLYLGQMLLNREPAIIQFLADRIQTEQDKKRWFRIVEYSRKTMSKTALKPAEDASHQAYLAWKQQGAKGTAPALSPDWQTWKAEQNAIKTAAANAMTILNYARVNFSGKDLSGIRIKGADLSQGLFHQTNLQQANLQTVQLQQSFLREANLNQAKLAGVVFGERAYFKCPASIYCLAYSPDGQIFAVGCQDSNIYLLDAQSGAVLKTLKGHTSGVSSLAWQGPVLASGSGDKTVRLWDTESGALRRVLEGHTDGVSSLAWRGQILASGSGDKTVRLWDTESGALRRVLEGHTDEVSSLAWQGPVLASGGWDTTVRLWDTESGTLRCVLKGHTDGVNNLAFQGPVLASGSWDTTVCLWDTESGALRRVLEGHTSCVSSFAWQGRILASGSYDKTVRLWDTESGTLRRVLEGHTDGVSSLAWQGNVLASGSWDHTVRLWDTESSTLRRVLEGHTYEISSLAFQGSVLVSGSQDGTMRLWDTESGALRRVLEEHTDGVSSLAWQGKMLASGSRNEKATVWLWDTETGVLRYVLVGHRYGISSLAWQGNVLASGGYDKAVRLWDAESGVLRRVLGGHTDAVSSLAWQGSVLASGSWDKTVRLWDTESGALRRVLKGHTDRVSSLAWQGRILASGSKDKTIRLWDSDTGECRHILQVHQSDICSLIFVLQGAYLLSFGLEGEVALWCTATGKLLERRRLLSQLSAVAYQSEALVTGDGHGRVMVWRVIGPDTLAQTPPRLPNWQLHWTSGAMPLEMEGMRIDGVRGLSESNQRLLEQRGATGTPAAADL